jgi:gluconate kinase
MSIANVNFASYRLPRLTLPPTLPRSQFETLEEPGEDEHPVVVTAHGTTAETVTELLHRLAI